MEVIGAFLAGLYPWTKALHVMSVIAWMAGLFYLPRLFVYHAERAPAGGELSEIYKIMERKLLKYIMNPASVAAWTFGLMLVFTPGLIDWSDGWVRVKAVLVVAMTFYHHLLVRWWRDFAEDRNQRPGRYYRIANEVPTLLMVGIVVMAVVRPF